MARWMVAGGVVSGGLTFHGGTAVISGTMAAGQIVNFAGSAGVLELDNLAAFHAKISGFTTTSEKIDLGGFAYSSSTETLSWTQSGTSGTLTVSDGAEVASLTLIGIYATSNFNLANDAHGGTFVYDPRACPPAFTRSSSTARTQPR